VGGCLIVRRRVPILWQSNIATMLRVAVYYSWKRLLWRLGKSYSDNWQKVTLTIGKRLLWQLAKGYSDNWQKVTLTIGKKLLWQLAKSYSDNWQKVTLTIGKPTLTNGKKTSLTFDENYSDNWKKLLWQLEKATLTIGKSYSDNCKTYSDKHVLGSLLPGYWEVCAYDFTNVNGQSDNW
jgi:hypothetical protein